MLAQKIKDQVLIKGSTVKFDTHLLCSIELIESTFNANKRHRKFYDERTSGISIESAKYI